MSWKILGEPDGIQRLTSISLTNYKTFQKSSIALKKYNVIIGANASGKSNFVSSIRLLRNLSRYGDGDSLSLAGNYSNMARQEGPNIVIETDVLSVSNEWGAIRLHLTPSKCATTSHANSFDGLFAVIKPRRMTYRFEIDARNHIVNHTFLFSDLEKGTPSGEEDEAWGRAKRLDNLSQITGKSHIELEKSALDLLKKIDSISLVSKKGNIEIRFISKDDQNTVENKIKKLTDLGLVIEINCLKETGMLEGHDPIFIEMDLFQSLSSWADGLTGGALHFDNIKSFDFEPKRMKEIQNFDVSRRLNEDGSNLNSVLRHIFQDPKEKGEFMESLQMLVPSITDVIIEEILPSKLILYITEEYSSKRVVSYNISDGTICLIALVTTLFHDDNKLLIFEEPERNFHPKLIPRIMSFIEEASEEKQIIITTHNPEFIKWADPENIIFMHRDDEGVSQADDILELPNVQYLLSKEIGIVNIFVNDSFGV